MSEKIQVYYEATPNPQSMKFILTAQIAEESRNFNSIEEANSSPLARKLFGFPWAAGVFIGPHFVTVTKQEWVDWDVLAEPLSNLISEHIERGEAVLSPILAENAIETDSSDSAIVKEIKRILNSEIRPAVAMDGGDILFHKYEDNKVYLRLQGACSGCPSSMITLKDGIEVRMKELIPEIKEVVSI